MSSRFATLVPLLSVLLFVGCGGKAAAPVKPLNGPPQPGATYSLNDGEGGFRVGKVVVSQEEVIFVQLYGNRWTSRPDRDALKTLAPPTPVAYSPATFAGMQPAHLKDDTVLPEEQDAYAAWKKSNADVF